MESPQEDWKEKSLSGETKPNKKKKQLEGYVVPFPFCFMFAGRFLPFSILQ